MKAFFGFEKIDLKILFWVEDFSKKFLLFLWKKKIHFGLRSGPLDLLFGGGGEEGWFSLIGLPLALFTSSRH